MSHVAAECRPEWSFDAPETILVVEDDEKVRKLAVFALKLAGYTVLESSDGEKAIEVASNCDRHIDLLIADVNMPKMSGWALANRLLAVRPGIKVLIVSGDGE